jgi:hypothetical protein
LEKIKRNKREREREREFAGQMKRSEDNKLMKKGWVGDG